LGVAEGTGEAGGGGVIVAVAGNQTGVSVGKAVAVPVGQGSTSGGVNTEQALNKSDRTIYRGNPDLMIFKRAPIKD